MNYLLFIPIFFHISGVLVVLERSLIELNYIHGPRMQRNFTGSKISTLNESKYTKSSPQFVFSRPIDRKIKMTTQPLIGRDIFVHLSRRHKHPLLGYISVRQILTFHIYEFSETACTQNPLTASYFSSQSLSACV